MEKIKTKKIEYEKTKAVRIVAHYNNFDQKGWNSEATEEQKTECWKLAFYEMWRLQMTWGYAYAIEARDSRSNGAYIDILTKECYADNVKETMEDFGYGGIISYEENIAIVDGFDIEEDIEDIFLAW